MASPRAHWRSGSPAEGSRWFSRRSAASRPSPEHRVRGRARRGAGKGEIDWGSERTRGRLALRRRPGLRSPNPSDRRGPPESAASWLALPSGVGGPPETRHSRGFLLGLKVIELGCGEARHPGRRGAITRVGVIAPHPSPKTTDAASAERHDGPEIAMTAHHGGPSARAEARRLQALVARYPNRRVGRRFFGRLLGTERAAADCLARRRGVGGETCSRASTGLFVSGCGSGGAQSRRGWERRRSTFSGRPQAFTRLFFLATSFVSRAAIEARWASASQNRTGVGGVREEDDRGRPRTAKLSPGDC